MQSTTFPSLYGIDLMAFTERLAQFRRAMGLTRKDLAAMVGLRWYVAAAFPMCDEYFPSQ